MPELHQRTHTNLGYTDIHARPDRDEEGHYFWYGLNPLGLEIATKVCVLKNGRVALHEKITEKTHEKLEKIYFGAS